ncbi:MAG: hypothetical protein H8E15_04370 [Planctomycetes bacterium]|nr:hypothetical protein [Planctomycetota bacterium]
MSSNLAVSPDPELVTTKRVFRLWLPLASSWMLMGIEIPMLTAFVARLPDDRIHLAAYGSVAFAIALVIEGPIIQLLAASTALCSDMDSFRKVRRFMYVAAGALTVLHLAVAFSPVYDFIARSLLQVPEEIIEPGRLGLQLLTPWTASIAYRRFYQGVLIRYERSKLVGVGTAIRLLALTAVLSVGSALAHFDVWELPGVAVGASAVSIAVMAEAAFIGWCTRPVVADHLLGTPAPDPPLSRKRFQRFYLPLALMPLLTLVIQPTGSAAMSRMPMAMESLAAWPVIHGLLFLIRSTGFALNEVVVALMGKPGAYMALRKFTMLLATVTSGFLLIFAVSPLSEIWFAQISGLDPTLVQFCSTALLIGVLMPAYQALQSWYGGILVHARQTRGITEAVVIYVIVAVIGLTTAARYSSYPGIYAALAIFVLGGLCQTAWLAWRSKNLGHSPKAQS